MLIASTNHPEKLDCALSNRPGRFDVVIELPAPDEKQRREYLRQKLLEIDAAAIDAAAATTQGISFAHLEEIVRLSGMIALGQGREFRVASDLAEAVNHVRGAFSAARNGYAKMPEVPFGIAGFRGDRK
jgi:ATP-dependent 26S proteasome regulatory subunit